MLVVEIVVTEMANLALGPCQALGSTLRCWRGHGAWVSAVGESYLGLNVDMVFCIKFDKGRVRSEEALRSHIRW